MSIRSDLDADKLPTALPELASGLASRGVLDSWRIDSVISRDYEFTSVVPDTSLKEVKTLMIVRDFSQIPVLSKNRRTLEGSVTWKSLARYRNEGMSVAREVMMRGAQDAKIDDPLLDHIPAIISDEFIYVKDNHDEYVAIVTTTDLAESFLKVSGPFMKLREVEISLRALLHPLHIDSIQSSLRPTPEGREINSVEDLTFGQYREVLESNDNWTAIGLPFDRKTILKNLQAVNEVRNNVMHFRPKPLESSQSIVIDQCLNWLRECSMRWPSTGLSAQSEEQIRD